MIPTYPTTLVESFNVIETEKPKKVYQIDWENNRLLSRKIDGKTAVNQNMDVIIAIEYLEHEVMPDWFGIAMKDLYGMPPAFVKANLERTIKEAMSPYLVLKRLTNFKIRDIDKESIEVTCNVELADGTVFEKVMEVPKDV